MKITETRSVIKKLSKCSKNSLEIMKCYIELVNSSKQNFLKFLYAVYVSIRGVSHFLKRNLNLKLNLNPGLMKK